MAVNLTMSDWHHYCAIIYGNILKYLIRISKYLLSWIKKYAQCSQSEHLNLLILQAPCSPKKWIKCWEKVRVIVFSIQYKRTLCFLIPRHLSFTFGPNSHVNSSIHSDHNNNFITIRGKYYLAIKIIFYDNSKFSEKNVYWFHVKTQKFQSSVKSNDNFPGHTFSRKTLIFETLFIFI